MEMHRDVIIAFIIVLFLATLGGTLTILWYRYRYHRRIRRKRSMIANMVEGLKGAEQPDELLSDIQQHRREALDAFVDIMQTLDNRDPRLSKLASLMAGTGLHRHFVNRLSSLAVSDRLEAAVYLGYLTGDGTLAALHSALAAETDTRVKLYICNSLTDIGDRSSIPHMVTSLLGEASWYRTRVNMMLASYQHKFAAYVPEIIGRRDPEIRSLLIDFGSHYRSSVMRRYLLGQTTAAEKDLQYRAVRGLAEMYPRDVFTPAFLGHSDAAVRNIVVKALVQITEKDVLDALMAMLSDEQCQESVVVTISEMARKRPDFIEYLISRFETETDVQRRDGLAKVLSNRIEYILLKLLADETDTTQSLVVSIVMQGKYSSLIGFLNRNDNIELENRILNILRPLLAMSGHLTDEARGYLKERILKKLGLEPQRPAAVPRSHVQAKGKKAFLLVLLAAAFAIMPLLYAILHYRELLIWDWYQHAVQFVLDGNYYFAFYALTINSIYFILMMLSFRAAHSQMMLWSLKKPKFLFKPRVLPGISIIAPAYREAATIVESVNSLLNLRYPNYELIVVNDGSPDNTLAKLIEEFELEKVDRVIPQKLQTMPILGIYASKSLPKLLVVDKINGGKADTLNAGINLSDKEFFCGIDADSLLESDSLIKLTSQMLDSPAEAVALGGNIFPINGCTVDRGVLEEICLPQSRLARFQTVEYIRAFMTGRLGWAKLQCLLIISGAFGLFRKDNVVEVGGYLTSKERYQLDTVGEDMELVVRLEHTLLERKKPFNILYAYNANCWTEVPESRQVLYRQRDRWQRGLIDVIHFHLTMLFNPRYKRIGLIAMPYFVIFELLGPLIEIQGYIMVVLAFFLGLLNQEIALLLFAASILYGIFISIASLIITVEDAQYFSAKELVILIFCAFIENFGTRQYFSLWRVTGFFNSLRSAQGWGSMPRKGFGVSTGSSQAG